MEADNRLDKIKEKLSKAPENPGIYQMRDLSGKIIYIGKAGSLKKRLSSYFHSKDHDRKSTVLINNIHDFDYVITDSETEALLLESALIKKHKPRYNIRLKDDKRYPYITVTLSETYPRIIVTRKIENKNDRYYGPYTDTKAARSMVNTINAIFKLRLCKKELPLKSNERPCLNFQMKKCSGLCNEKTTKDEYLQIIKNAMNFLEGRIQPVINELDRLMKNFSGKQEYEKAGQIRDIIKDIRRSSQSQKVATPVGADKDYISLLVQGDEAIILIFEFRNGALLGRKINIFENIEASEKGEILKSFVMDYYSCVQPPPRIVSQYGINDTGLIENHLTGIISRKVRIATAKTADDRGIMNMIRKNLDVIASDRLVHQKYRDKKKGLLEIKTALNLESIPQVIECFDISNIQGKNAVASMVRFLEGNPDKSGYRRYRIKSLDTPNDPAMIHEAVARRLQHLVNEDEKLPDLIVIDGGKGQLNRAIEARTALEADVKIVSIAKQFEEIYTEESKEPIRLDKSSPGLKIIRHIRDEAHRFAIAYHKKLRDKESVKSQIDEIPNIGEKRKKLLLQQMGSVERIKSSTLEEIGAIPGMGEKTARIVYDFFHREKNSSL